MRLIATSLYVGLALVGSVPVSSTPIKAEVTGSYEGLVLRDLRTRSPRVLEVRLVDVGEGPLRLWKDSNSWGAGRWRVFRIRGGKLTGFFQMPTRPFSMNVPSYRQLAPNDAINQILDMSDDEWHGTTGGAEFRNGDVVVLAYDVPLTNEALKYEVWHGVVVAKIEVTGLK